MYVCVPRCEKDSQIVGRFGRGQFRALDVLYSRLKYSLPIYNSMNVATRLT